MLDLFRKDVGSFTRAYEFLAQIFDHGDTDLEERYHFSKALAALLRDENLHQAIDLSGAQLTHYRLSDQGMRDLQRGSAATAVRPVTSVGGAKVRDEKLVALSELIQAINNLFDGELTDADAIAYLDHVAGKLLERDHLGEQARHNTKEQFSLGSFDQDFIETVLEGLDHYQAMASQVQGNDRVRSGFARLVRDLVS